MRYNTLLIIFTMNSYPEDIDKLDKSYIRNNRIDLGISIDKNK